jgi:hypothetical protein
MKNTPTPTPQGNRSDNEYQVNDLSQNQLFLLKKGLIIQLTETEIKALLFIRNKTFKKNTRICTVARYLLLFLLQKPGLIYALAGEVAKYRTMEGLNDLPLLVGRVAAIPVYKKTKVEII